MFQYFLPTADAGSLRRGRSLPVLDRVGARNDARVWDTTLLRDLKTVARFLDLYCQCKHVSVGKEPVNIPGFDVDAIARTKVSLCQDCTKLLTHAFVKRSHCPMKPKPACKHCPNHCYHPTYRKQIREVMRFSGARLLLTGRLDYLFHMLF